MVGQLLAKIGEQAALNRERARDAHVCREAEAALFHRRITADVSLMVPYPLSINESVAKAVVDHFLSKVVGRLGGDLQDLQDNQGSQPGAGVARGRYRLPGRIPA